MSKRLCVSLISSRSPPSSLRSCSAILRPTTARGNTLPIHLHNDHFLRPFSATSHSRALAGSRMRPGQKAQPSVGLAMKRQQKTAEKDGTVLELMGILDGTFIYPSGKNLPSPTANPRGRWKIEWYRVWTALTDWGMVMFTRLISVRPRLWSGKILEKGEVPRLSKEIYENMYTSFARGDLKPVENQLRQGLLSSLRARLAQRSPNSGMHWTMHGYLQAPKVMSFKFQTLPGGSDKEKNGVVQAVVKLRSKQSLIKLQKVRVKDELGRAVLKAVPVDSSGTPLPESEVEGEKERNSKVTTEYVVLQRMLKKGKFGPWLMWGTAEESSLAKIEQDSKDMAAKQDQMAAMRGQT